MPGTPVEIGPWDGGLKNVSGFGEFIDDNQAYLLQNFEVDADKSLTNRPAILRAPITGFGTTNTNGMRFIGTWITNAQRYLIVAATATGVSLIEAATSTVVFSQVMTKPRACVSFNGVLYIIPTQAGQGGSISSVDIAYTWTARATIPTGISAAVYKDRLYIAQELESRIVYSDINNFISFPAPNNVGIGWDNKQPLKAMLVVGSDLFLFKTDSTYRYGHAGDPAKAEVRVMDNYVGTTNEATVTVYNNNTVYTLSGNCVYELYQNTYTKISDDLDMVRNLDATMFVNHEISVFKERLFVRLYSRLYVLSLTTQKWCEWTSSRVFSNLVYLPGIEPGDDVAYMPSNRDTAGSKFMYYMHDSRIIGVAANPSNLDNLESFTCKLVTKSLDFATPTYYKTILMGGLSVACSSVVTISAVVPGSAVPSALSWGEAFVQYTWGLAYDLGLTWGTEVTADGDIISKSVIPPTDGAAFGRKLLKCLSKFRYRQVQFVIEVPAASNNRASFSVRLFNLTVYAVQKQTVVKSVTP